MRAIRLETAAVLGAPLIFSVLAMTALLVDASSGLSNPLPFGFFCLLAAVTYVAVGVTVIRRRYQVLAWRELELAIAVMYVLLGLFGLLADLVVVALMTSCRICI